MLRRSRPAPSVFGRGWSGAAAALLVAASLGIAAPSPTRAATTIVVNTAIDEVTGGDGKCSLREAVIAADFDAPIGGCTAGRGADTIRVPAGMYLLSHTGRGEADAFTGDLNLKGIVTIVGAGASSTIIDGYGLVNSTTADDIFDVRTGANVVLSGLTLTHGAGGDNHAGGDVLQHPGSQLSISRSIIRDGHGAFGGGILVSGSAFPELAAVDPATLTVSDSTISGDHADSAGGGVFVGAGATLNLIRSAVIANAAPRDGDGILNAGTANVTNATIANNGDSYLDGFGGGIENGGALALQNVTLHGNFAGYGGNVHNSNPDATKTTAHNTIFSEPGAGGDCTGTKPTSFGHNLEWSPFSTGSPCISAATDVYGDPAFPKVAPSGNTAPPRANGGPTATLALGLASAARDHGASCATTDQRSVPRPQGPACDIGAYELALCFGKVVTITGSAGNDVITGTNGNDVIETFGGNDVVSGLRGDDAICADAGNDSIRPGPGNDAVYGGTGTDLVTYSAATAAVSVNLSLSAPTATGEGTDQLRSLENVMGSPFADTLRGSSGPNLLRGLAGNDHIYGLGGNDVLYGDSGTDTLDGGTGTDVCHYAPTTGPHTGCETYTP